jgi:hypothetical protein
MSIKQNPYLILFFCWILILGCASNKTASTPETPIELRPRSAMYLLKQNEKSWIDYHHIGMKLEGDFHSNMEDIGFKCNVRIAKDSALWLSISPALGIEVARALLLDDSLKLLSKIPDNKFGYLAPLEEIERWLHFQLDLEDLQNLMIGKPIGIDRIGGKFKSEIVGNQYLINTRYKRKLKKNINFIQTLGDSLSNKTESEREKRKLQRIDQDGLIISQYWLDGQSFVLDKMKFNDLINQKTIEIEYREWNKDISNAFYPTKGSIHIVDDSLQYQFEWEITKLVNDRIFDFPFEIPDDYEIKKTP